ncbi:MAG: leucine-rich repeat protein [Bacteroidales bacterium]|nr:leucine-rich repeat protein [Bacteroidales bacterium]
MKRFIAAVCSTIFLGSVNVTGAENILEVSLDELENLPVSDKFYTARGSENDNTFCFYVDKASETASLYLLSGSGSDNSDVKIPSFIKLNGKIYSVSYIGNYENIYDKDFESYINSVLTPDRNIFIDENIFNSVTIPNTVKGIGMDLTLSDVRCNRFLLEDTNEYFVEDDGVIYSSDYSVAYLFPSRKEDTYISPQSVKMLKPGIFTNATAPICLQNEISTIPNETFIQAFPLSSESKSDNAGIYISSSVKSIGESAFAFTTTPFLCDGIETIGNYAFEYGDFYPYMHETPHFFTSVARHEIVLPESIKEIGDYAFYNRWRRKEVDYLNVVPSIKNIYFLSATPPIMGEHSLPEPLIPEYADEELKQEILDKVFDTTIFVPADAIENYEALKTNGIINEAIKISPLPDYIYIGSIPGIKPWNQGQSTLSYQAYELGDEKIESVEWIVDNHSIASVDSEGNITALQEGTVNVSFVITGTSGQKYSSQKLPLKITEKIVSGINAIESDNMTEISGVFNLHGIRVADSPEGLPKGIYIYKGKKLVIRN